MELISREEVKTIIECATGYHTAIKDAFDRVMELPTIDLIYCQECEYLTPRERLEEPIKRRLPKELIGNCEKTKLYVHENDYCCGADMRGEEQNER